MNIEMIDNTGETLHEAGGVPELPKPYGQFEINDGCAVHMADFYDGTPLFTAAQLRAYGEQCALAALAARPLSGGWVSVPKEPTQAMLNFLIGASGASEGIGRRRYAAMLAAVPKAPEDAKVKAAYADPPYLGRVSVPEDPTAAMIAAAERVEDLYKRGTPQTWAAVYRAMLEAAAQEREDQ